MDYPTGVVPKVEHQWSHREFVRAVKPDAVMTDIVSARQIVKRGETADSYFGEDVDVVVTTTVPDEKLRLIDWERERDIVREFEPAYHVPTDYSIYDHHSAEERRETLAKMREGTLWMRDELMETDTRVIPQIKGFNLNDRKETYRAVDEVGSEYACYYATQYFTGGNGIRINDLVADLGQIEAETNGRFNLLVIGLLSPRYLSRVGEAVVAGCGQNQWRKRVAPRENTDAEMQAAYGELVEAAEAALDGDGDAN